MSTALVFDVRRFSTRDGPGIRTTVFFKGCPLGCLWCHNPESRGRSSFVHHDPGRCLRCGACVAACDSGALSMVGGEPMLDATRCEQQGACVEACPSEARIQVGRTRTVAALVDEIERDRLYYESSGGGVTFSGGEPLLQWRVLVELLDACGERDLHRVVDTTGHADGDVLMRVAERTDLFLYDLKVMDADTHRRVTGVPLEPILENLGRLLSGGARVRIRVPMVPGVTTDASIERTAALLIGLPPVEGVDLLPYHPSARDKHRRFRIPWRLPDADPIPADRVEGWRARLADRGLPVGIGG